MSGTAAALLDQARTAGVTLRLAEPSRLTLRGDPKIVARWAPLLRPHRAWLLALLTEARPTWDIREPSGETWLSTFAPPQTMVEVLSRYQAGTTAAPVDDTAKDKPIRPDIEAAVTAFLDKLGETDPVSRAEALHLARIRPSVLARYRDMAKAPKPPGPTDGTEPNGCAEGDGPC